MKIYSNEQAIQIEKIGYSFSPSFKIIDLNKESFDIKSILGNTAFFNATSKQIAKTLIFLEENLISSPIEMIFLVKDLKLTKIELKEEFVYIKAAGGLVTNTHNQYLMIKRLGKWDLPKGKAEKGETDEITALREVEEECGIKAKLGRKIGNTWHLYKTKKFYVLKRTKWFNMSLISDKNMKPQIEENIEEIIWVSENTLKEKMNNTYLTIKEVFKASGIFIP